MKYVLMILMSLSMIACASHRAPSSVQEDVPERMNRDFYGTR